MNAKRKRDIHLHLMVTPDEQEQIRERMAEAGIQNAGAYLRKMALNGYILHVDLARCGSLFPCNGVVQTISIRLPFKPIPTAAYTRTRLQGSSVTMGSYGAGCLLCWNSLRPLWKNERRGNSQFWPLPLPFLY